MYVIATCVYSLSSIYVAIAGKVESFSINIYCAVVDGGWSSWTLLGSCSCKSEIEELDTRICNNPPSSCGGLPCKGSDTRQALSCIDACCPGKIIYM